MLVEFLTKSTSWKSYWGARSNPDPHSPTFARTGIEFGDGSHERHSGTYSPLGIVVVRSWIAKIGQHTIAYVLGKVEVCRSASPRWE
ncbi:hypothetical protein AWB81_07997 [Caballeronia arationis]|jgi:hypothetical protein|nr:hypothetical protein AWB81_07997 [Caballeronia arationis]